MNLLALQLGEKNVRLTLAKIESFCLDLGTTKTKTGCIRTIRQMNKLIDLQSWGDFEKQLSPLIALEGTFTCSTAFRGHSKTWGNLKPSLLRRLVEFGCESTYGKLVEHKLLKTFRSQAHLHLGNQVAPRDTDDLGWFMLMQHHRAPTRLLDWSSSPYVAAYFAVLSEFDSDGEIWAANNFKLRGYIQDNLETGALTEFDNDPTKVLGYKKKNVIYFVLPSTPTSGW